MPSARLEVWNAIVASVSSGAAVIGLAAIWFQVRAGRLTMQASVDGQVYSRLDTINQILLSRPSLERELEKAYSLDTEEALSAKNLADMFFTLFEQIHKQKSAYRSPNLLNGKPLMAPDQWRAWELTIMNAMCYPFLAGYWTDNAYQRYPAPFSQEISLLLRSQDYQELLARKRPRSD